MIDALGGIPDAFVKGFDNGIKYIYDNFFAWLVEPLKNLLPGIVDGLPSAAKKAAESIFDAFMSPVNALQKAFDGLFGGFDSFVDKAKGLLGKIGGFLGFGGDDEKSSASNKAEITVKPDTPEKSGGGFLDGLTDKVGGFMSSMFSSPSPAIAGAPAGIAANNAASQNSVNTDMKVTVQTTVNAAGDAEEVAAAVSGGVDKAMSRARDYIQNSVSGVVQKG